MSEIQSIVDWIIRLVTENIYPGVFLAALIETVFPPIPSEVVFPLAGYSILQGDMPAYHVIGVGITGGSGATVGAVVIYVIALRLGREIVVRICSKIRVKEKQIKRAELWFEKYGDKTVLFGRMVPGLRELVSVPAGILNMRFGKFLIYTFVGSCTWSMALTMVGYYFGVATFELF